MEVASRVSESWQTFHGDVKRYFYALVHLRLVTALGGWFFTLYH